ncbi:hypothetical protein Droror1_Dr00016252 [Drosera rotundifolia]
MAAGEDKLAASALKRLDYVVGGLKMEKKGKTILDVILKYMGRLNLGRGIIVAAVAKSGQGEPPRGLLSKRPAPRDWVARLVEVGRIRAQRQRVEAGSNEWEWLTVAEYAMMAA